MTLFTQNLQLSKPTPQDPAVKNLWGTLLNTDDDIVDQAVAGVLPLNLPSQAGYPNIALTSTQGQTDQAKNRYFLFTGVLTQNTVVFWPSGLARFFTVSNQCTGAFTLTLAVNNGNLSPLGQTVTLPEGQQLAMVNDGTNISVQDSPLAAAPAQVVGVPIGTVLDFAGGAAPTGFLFADGSVVAQATWPALFAVIGTTFNTGGEGAGAFRLPDYRGRVSAGIDAGAGRLGTGATNGITGQAVMGAVGGEQQHTQQTTEIAAHNHSLTDPGHAHTIPGGYIENTPGGVATIGAGATVTAVGSATVSAATGITLASVGNSTPFNVVQPTIVVAKIIRAA